MKLIIIIGIAVLLLTAIYVAMQFRSVEKMEDGNGGTSKHTARFFSMEGCPHCVSFDSEWKEFAGMSSVNAEKHVYYRRESGSNTNDSYVKQYVMGDESVVSSFPTVLFVDADGNYVKYDGDRSASGLKKGWDKWVSSQK